MADTQTLGTDILEQLQKLEGLAEQITLARQLHENLVDELDAALIEALQNGADTEEVARSSQLSEVRINALAQRYAPAEVDAERA